MNALQNFLLETDVSTLEQEVIVSKRLAAHPFVITPMSDEQLDGYQKVCVSNPNNAKKRSVNTAKLNMLIVKNHTKEPNFQDADFIKKSGCVTSENLIRKVLLSGEILNLSQAIMELSGYDTTGERFQEDMDEVKNS